MPIHTQDSYKRIAKVLTIAGLEGRQSRGQPFPAETVKGWYHRAPDDSDRERIQSAIDKAKTAGGAESYLADTLLAMLMRPLNSAGSG